MTTRTWLGIAASALLGLCLGGHLAAAPAACANGAGGDLLADMGPDGGSGGPGGPDDQGGPPPADFRDGGPQHGPGGMGPHHGDPLEGLDLTQDQKTQLKALRRAERPKMQELQNALDDAREDLRDLLSSGGRGEDFDAKARAKNRVVLDLERKLGEVRFESILKIRKVLTDDQLKELGRRHGGHGMDGGPDGFDDQMQHSTGLES